MNLNPQERAAASHMLGHYRYEGHPRGGSFTTKLIELLEVADSINTAKILGAFPEYRPAYGVMTTQGGEALQAIMAAQK